MSGEDEPRRAASNGYASPACYLHEVDPAYGGFGEEDEQQRIDVARWRRAERKRLLALRLALDPDDRRRADQALGEALTELLGDSRGRVLAVYWPVCGEPDLRPWMKSMAAKGFIIALPAPSDDSGETGFRIWREGVPLLPGRWGIPAPQKGEAANPDLLIAPCLGFDPSCHRLGYGGGWLDLTVAALARRPRLLGAAYGFSAIPTIFPQRHDLAMEAIVTEDGVAAAATAG